MISIDTSLAPNEQKILHERRARKERLNPRPRRRQPRIQTIAELVAAVAVVGEAEVEAGEEAPVAEGVVADRVHHG